MRKKWTEEENILFEEKRKSGLTVFEISKFFPDRTYGSIKERLRVLKDKKSIWTKEKIDILLEKYKDHTIYELVDILGIKYQTIWKKCSDLNIKPKAILYTYSEEDDEYIRKNYYTMSSSNIGKKFGVSPSAIQQRANKLGLYKSNRQWTKKDEEYLVENYKTSDIYDIANYLQRNISSIHTKARELGLKDVTSEKNFYKEEFVRNNYLTMTDAKIGEVLGISSDSVVRIRKNLGILKTSNTVSGKTDIEKFVCDILDSLNIKYLYNSNLGHYRPDIQILDSNKIIEVNGDYWHCNPMVYTLGPKDDVQIRHIINDYYKKCFYISNNYEVLYIWEYDIFNNPNKVKEDIKNFLPLSDRNAD